MRKLWERKEHCIELFGTRWDSTVQALWWYEYPQWGIKLRQGYVDINVGLLHIRLRGGK